MGARTRYGMVIKYEDVAAMLANESSNEQSAFFNVFAKELRRSCQTAHHCDMQIGAIRSEMTTEAIEVMQWE